MSYQHVLLEKILSNNASEALSGVQVYHNNFIENGIRALSITFPTVNFLLEQGIFRALAKAYLLTETKQCFDWADYGVSFSDFVMAHPSLRQMPYLGEVAELDWLVHQTQRSKDISFNAESFSLLSQQDPSELSFVTAPGFTIAKFYFPVIDFYTLANTSILQEEGDARTQFMQQLNSSVKDAIKSDSPRSIVLWRPDFKAEMQSLSDIETSVFQRVNTGDSIANIFALLTQLAQNTEGAEQFQDLSAWLSEQIRQKRIYGVHSTHN